MIIRLHIKWICERIEKVFKILLVAAIWKMLRELKIGKYVQVTSGVHCFYIVSIYPDLIFVIFIL